MAHAPKGLEEWVRRRLVTPPVPDSFSLRHSNGETGESQKLESFRTAGDPGDIAREIAAEAYRRACDHASAFPGRPQRFVLTAVCTGKAEGRYSFLARSEGRIGAVSGDMASGGFESEPPTEKGVTTQMMRHTEAAWRLTVESLSSTVETLRIENQQLRAERERDQERRFKFIEHYETMLDRRAERDLILQKAERDAQRKDIMVAHLIQKVLPAVAKALPDTLGQFIGGEPSTPRVLETVRGILGSLDAEAIEYLLRKLPDEQRQKLEGLVDAMGSGPADSSQSGDGELS